MRSQIRQILMFFVIFILIVDGISFAGLLLDFSAFRNPFIYSLFWSISITYIAILYRYGKLFLAENRPGFFAGFYVFSGFFLALYVPKLIYIIAILLEFLLKLMAWPVLLVFTETPGFQEFIFHGKLNFISFSVLPLSVITLFVILGGMIFGRFRFRVRPIEINSPDLPAAFDGFRIIHISDLHLGSLFGHQDKFRKAVEMINRQSPDLVLFTGDLVNNLAGEADGWTDLLSEITSSQGNFSILGNHDYGEYYNWPDEESRMANMENLFKAHEDSGFSLLLNRSLKINKGEQEIYLAGVENWGLPPFKQYGDLDKALEKIPKDSFTVLLSHDPSHWDAEILEKTRVQLTLSGHTHGMQFGIRTKRFKWSPVQLKYPRWIGLYREGKQFLHVNPGLGYIGYAGRIWIPPEISLITLKRTV